MELKGSKVVLRYKRLRDAHNDYAWSTDRELMRLDAAEPCSLPFTVYMASYPHGLSDPNKIQLAIDTAEGTHIGNCVCYNIDRVRGEGEVGIMIGDRAYWGQGYGSDALSLFLQYLFNELALERVFLHTLDWNLRAQGCFERCGFTPTGHVARRGFVFVKMEATAAHCPA